MENHPQDSQYTLDEMKGDRHRPHRLGRRLAAHAHGARGDALGVDGGVGFD